MVTTQQELETLRQAHLGEETPIADLPKALHKLWEDDHSGTRASLTNLAIYSEELGTLIENSQILPRITSEHACRGLLIMATQDQDGSTDPRAWLTAQCQLDAQGRKTVCSEQLAFMLPPGRPNLLRNTVFSHLESDLPLIFWWQGNLSNNFEDRLYTIIDRLLIDSNTWDHPYHYFKTILTARKHSRFALHDLNWTRTYPMRLALAQSFEEPAAQKFLPRLQKIHITRGKRSSVATLMLGAWIADRLKCELQIDPDKKHAEFRPGKDSPFQSPIPVIIEKSDSPATVAKLELTGESESLTLKHDVEKGRIHTVGNLQEPTREQLLSAPIMETAELVLTQLSRARSRSPFVDLLPKVLPLLKEHFGD